MRKRKCFPLSDEEVKATLDALGGLSGAAMMQSLLGVASILAGRDTVSRKQFSEILRDAREYTLTKKQL